MENFENFREKLNEVHSWPSLYLFKFIVPGAGKAELLDLMPSGLVEERWSKNQKYVSISLKTSVRSADEVIIIYQKVAHIEGLVAL